MTRPCPACNASPPTIPHSTWCRQLSADDEREPIWYRRHFATRFMSRNIPPAGASLYGLRLRVVMEDGTGVDWLAYSDPVGGVHMPSPPCADDNHGMCASGCVCACHPGGDWSWQDAHEQTYVAEQFSDRTPWTPETAQAWHITDDDGPDA